MKSPHKHRSLVLVATVTVMLAGMSTAPATAHVNKLPVTDYNDGSGSFVATSYPNTQGCADYSHYTATLVFPNDGATATVNSTAGHIWGEFADGTYNTVGPDAPCPGSGTTHGGGGQPIGGFSGTFTDDRGECLLSDGTYTRGHFGRIIEPPDSPPYNHPELNIAYQFDTVEPAVPDTACPTAPLILKTTIVHEHVGTPPFFGPYTTACNSPIAPQTCALGPQENTSEW